MSHKICVSISGHDLKCVYLCGSSTKKFEQFLDSGAPAAFLRSVSLRMAGATPPSVRPQSDLEPLGRRAPNCLPALRGGSEGKGRGPPHVHWVAEVKPDGSVFEQGRSSLDAKGTISSGAVINKVTPFLWGAGDQPPRRRGCLPTWGCRRRGRSMSWYLLPHSPSFSSFFLFRGNYRFTRIIRNNAKIPCLHRFLHW